MARNLAHAGYPVHLFDVDSAAVARAAALPGATPHASPAAVASASAVLFTALPNDAVVTETYLGPQGVLAGARGGLVSADCATVSPEVSQRISEITYADKTNYDGKSCAWVNHYIDLVKTLHEQVDLLPAGLRNQIEQEYTRICQEKRVHLDITIIQRAAFPNEQAEQVSRELDFSPERIEELMSQGYRDAKQALE